MIQCFGRLVEGFHETILAFDAHCSIIQILWLTAALAWGTLKLIGLRMLSGVVGEEGAWAFGQIMPMLLTILPLWLVSSSIYGLSIDTYKCKSLIYHRNQPSRCHKSPNDFARREQLHRAVRGRLRAVEYILVLQIDRTHVWNLCGFHWRRSLQLRLPSSQI